MPRSTRRRAARAARPLPSSVQAQQHLDHELVEALVAVAAHGERVEPLGLGLQRVGLAGAAGRRSPSSGVEAAASASCTSGSESKCAARSASAR